MDWMFVSPQNPYVEILHTHPSAMVQVDGTFGTWLGRDEVMRLRGLKNESVLL